MLLITNEDGIVAPGIKALVEVASQFGEVLVVAPDSPQSGQGHAITLNNPLKLRKVDIFEGIDAYECSGTPVDCVKLAKNVLLKGKKIDLCVSGINLGANSSINNLYSGTMSAAMEASIVAPAPPSPPAAARAGAATGGVPVDLHLDGFSRPPGDLKAVDVRYNQDDSAIALAEIMLSFGRLEGAAETLARHVEDSASDNPRPWLMLLDLYRRGGLRADYAKLLPALRKKFNLQVPAWQVLENPVSGLKSLEDYEHVITQLTDTWGTRDCLNYLYRLVHDNREGQRIGFPLEVVEEIVLLMLVLESAYGLERVV